MSIALLRRFVVFSAADGCGTLMDPAKFDQALHVYEQVLTVYDKFDRAHYQIGLLLLDRGELKGAIDHFRRTPDLDSSKAFVYISLGGGAVAGRTAGRGGDGFRGGPATF
jgi:tetratricopeptide (TPR) repeat protein